MKEELNKVFLNLLLIYSFLLPIQGIFAIGPKDTYIIKFALLSLAWAALFLSSDLLKGELKKSERRFFYLIPAFYLLWMGMVNYLNSSPLASFQEGMATALVLSSAALFTAACCMQNSRRRIILCAIFGLLIALLLCWIYFFARYDFLPKGFLNHSRRLYGVIKSPNAVAYASIALIILVIYAASRSWLSKRLTVFVFFVAFSSFYAALSRASFIALVPAALYLLNNHSVWVSNWKLRKVLVMTAGISLVAVVMMFVADGYFGFLGYHKSNVSTPIFNSDPVLNTLRVKENVIETGNRIQVWIAGLKVVSSHWILGIGQANWKQVLSSYGVKDYDSPHNGLLEIVGGFGLVGMFLYFFIPFFIWRQHCGGDAMRRGLLRFLVIFTLTRELVEVSTIFSFAIPGMLFWIVVGLLV